MGASAMVFWGWRGGAGIRSAPVRGCGMRNKRSLGRRSRFGVGHSGRCPFFAGRKAGLCFAVCFDFQSLACGRPGFENRCASIVFRSCFDSAEARQTVRWGRFGGLLFAPGFGAGRRQGVQGSVQTKPSLNPVQTQSEPQRAFAGSPVRFVCAMNRALLCPDCGVVVASRVFGVC